MRNIRTIMLIDDDADEHLLFAKALQEVDQNIQYIGLDECRNIGKVGAYIESHLPQFIFMDMNMPLVNGAQCMAAIKSYVRTPVVPLVLYTTSNSERDISQAQEAGAAYHLKKALHHELVQVLSHLIDGGALVKDERIIQKLLTKL